ncbi:hypothetical protein [Limosilactobacillus oris]|uniref:hypothetical protein n=1 Tax=Limosilactobacillus oris TaxID=1632 RepID=UPI00265AE41C|nr:hypothetical protein [Limosilactobacillus oris]
MGFNDLKNKIVNYPVDGNQIFFVSFLALYVGSFIKFTTFSDYISPNLISRCLYLIVGLLIIKIYFFDELNLKIFLLDSLALLIAFAVWRRTHAFDIVICTALILGARNIDFRFLMEYFFKVGTIILVFVILSSQLGIIKDLMYVRHGFTRHALGINYPTDFGAHVLYLVLAYCYLHFKQLNWKSYFSLFIIGVLLMLVTQARLDVAAIFLAIPVMFVAQRAYEHRDRFIQLASFYWTFPVLLAYISLTAAYFYTASNKIFYSLNKLFSDRLRLSHMATSKYDFRMLGNFVLENGFGGSKGFKLFTGKSIGRQYFYMDSSFIRLFIIYGIIVSLAVMAVMTIIALRSIISHDYCLAGIMFLVSISGLIEPHLLDVAFNPFLMALLATNVYYTIANDKILEESK